MSARDDLLGFIDRAGWDGTDLVNALVAETRHEAFQEVALIARSFPDPNPLASIFVPFVGTEIARAIERNPA